jgi:hypothetical protein
MKKFTIMTLLALTVASNGFAASKTKNVTVDITGSPRKIDWVTLYPGGSKTFVTEKMPKKTFELEKSTNSFAGYNRKSAPGLLKSRYVTDISIISPDFEEEQWVSEVLGQKAIDDINDKLEKGGSTIKIGVGKSGIAGDKFTIQVGVQ